MALKFEDLSKEIIFTHCDEITRLKTIIAIERLIKSNKYRCLPTRRADMDLKQAKYVYEHRGIEPHRLTKFVNEGVRDPLTFLKWPDGTDLLADGNHRYVAHAVLKEKTFTLKLVPASIWKPFVVINPPEFTEEAWDRFSNGYSGIPA
jgi:hypothetical protein